MTRWVLIAVTARGVARARMLRERLGAGLLIRPQRYGPAVAPWDRPYAGALARRVRALFGRADQLVFFLAIGAVTRLIAPCLGSKRTDPGVLAVDEQGRFAVPVLSGHRGGANAAARRIAGCLGAMPVVTTASDRPSGLSPDLLAAEFGWVAEPDERLTATSAALVDGRPVALVQEVGARGAWLDERALPANVATARRPEALPRRDYAAVLWITDRTVDPGGVAAPERVLWLRPNSLVLGIGCERGLPPATMEEGLAQFLTDCGFARAAIAAAATLDLKGDEPAIRAICRRHGWPLHLYSAAELAAIPAAHPSATVARCVGTPAVAEPAALAGAAGPLVAEKRVYRAAGSPKGMTFALARRGAFRTAEPGTVCFIGAGPGDPDLLTVRAQRILEQAEVVIYAGSLIPEAILRAAPPGATLHDSAGLTLEAIIAIIETAVRAGRRVVRLQSGDPSLYGALHEQLRALAARRIAYEVVPGVSAFQAAAAALGCELTVPEIAQTVILTRAPGRTPVPERETLAALAAHRATLCLFLSAGRAEAVAAALRPHYPPATPVAILYRVTWPDQRIIRTDLAHLAAEMRAHRFRRTVLILVGEALGEHPDHRSKLYDGRHAHRFRQRSAAPVATRRDG